MNPYELSNIMFSMIANDEELSTEMAWLLIPQEHLDAALYEATRRKQPENMILLYTLGASIPKNATFNEYCTHIVGLLV